MRSECKIMIIILHSRLALILRVSTPVFRSSLLAICPNPIGVQLRTHFPPHASSTARALTRSSRVYLTRWPCGRCIWLAKS